MSYKIKYSFFYKNCLHAFIFIGFFFQQMKKKINLKKEIVYLIRDTFFVSLIL